MQDAFGDTTAKPDMGKNEAIALDVVGWKMTADGLALEAVPEPSSYALLLTGAAFLTGFLNFRPNRRGRSWPLRWPKCVGRCGGS